MRTLATRWHCEAHSDEKTTKQKKTLLFSVAHDYYSFTVSTNIITFIRSFDRSFVRFAAARQIVDDFHKAEEKRQKNACLSVDWNHYFCKMFKFDFSIRKNTINYDEFRYFSSETIDDSKFDKCFLNLHSIQSSFWRKKYIEIFIVCISIQMHVSNPDCSDHFMCDVVIWCDLMQTNRHHKSVEVARCICLLILIVNVTIQMSFITDDSAIYRTTVGVVETVLAQSASIGRHRIPDEITCSKSRQHNEIRDSTNRCLRQFCGKLSQNAIGNSFLRLLSFDFRSKNRLFFETLWLLVSSSVVTRKRLCRTRERSSER